MTKGMTLLEILIVVGLTAAISAAGIVSLSQLNSIFKLRNAGDEIRTLMQQGRELAIANKNTASYTISYLNGVVILSGSGVELGRYLPPAGITFAPANFNWGFTPLSGKLTGCALPCQLTLSNSGNSEIITILENGIIN